MYPPRPVVDQLDHRRAKGPRLTGVQNACKILAKDLVRTRRYVQKFTQMRVQLQAVSLRMQTLRSNEQMASAMKGATRARLCGYLRARTDANRQWDR